MKKPSIDPQTARQIVIDHLSRAGTDGGSKTSPAKARAARKNGKKGGRPKDRSINRIDCQNCGPNMRHAYNYHGNAFICMFCGAQNDR